MEEHAQQQSAENPNQFRRRLGRGLNALLGGAEAGEDQPNDPAPVEPGVAAAADLIQVSVTQIEANPFQPRHDLGEESLQDLVASVKQHGILQPILIRQVGTRYQLVAGQRRLRAAQQAQLATVPCRLLELDDQQLCEAAIEENLKRKDLNVLEKAAAFQRYLKQFEKPIEHLAQQLSLNRSTVSNYLRLLELPETVKEAVRADKLSFGHARALLALDEFDCISVAERIQKESLSVRATEKCVRDVLKARQASETETVPFEKLLPPEMSSHVLSLQQQLQDQLGCKVEIKPKGKDSGKIIVHFSSNDDFERIVQRVRSAA